MKDIYDTYQSLFSSFISKLGTPLSHCEDMARFDDIAKNMFTGDYDRTSSIVFYLGDLGDQDVVEAIQDEVEDDSIDFYRKSEDLRLQQLSLFLEAVQFDEGDTLDPIRTLQLLHKYGSFKIGADLSKSKRSSSIRKQSIG